jgi:hypothetical protein
MPPPLEVIGVDHSTRTVLFARSHPVHPPFKPGLWRTDSDKHEESFAAAFNRKRDEHAQRMLWYLEEFGES